MHGIYCPTAIEEGDKRGEEKWIRVQLWLVTRLDTPLPVSVNIGCGGVICTTLGEAYENNIAVWWREPITGVISDNCCVSIGWMT
jgi:hypothetical protein